MRTFARTLSPIPASLLLILAAMALADPRAPAESVDLRPLMSPVKHQGHHRNTCNAFAATALMEFLLKTGTGGEYDLSEAYAYWAGKNRALDSDFLRRMYLPIDGNAGFLAVKAYESGSMLERDWPYEEKNWLQTGDPRCGVLNGVPDSACFTGTPPDEARVLDLRLRLELVDRARMGEFLLRERRPLSFNVQWYFEAVDRYGNFRMPTPEEIRLCNDGNGGCAGHVILLVGYDQDAGKFIFRNSWGQSWGSGGYGTLPERYVMDHCEVCGHLSNLDRYPQETREFVLRASQGATGVLAR